MGLRVLVHLLQRDNYNQLACEYFEEELPVNYLNKENKWTDYPSYKFEKNFKIISRRADI